MKCWNTNSDGGSGWRKGQTSMLQLQVGGHTVARFTHIYVHYDNGLNTFE